MQVKEASQDSKVKQTNNMALLHPLIVFLGLNVKFDGLRNLQFNDRIKIHYLN